MTEETRTVLFDLDGTLADTAPDLACALNTLLAQEKRAPLPLALIRPTVSYGTPAMLRLAFDLGPGDSAFAALRARLLALYAARIAHDTTLFPGVPELLASLERRGLRWGVVTNKPAALTIPLLVALGLDRRAACVVSGDTTAFSKPHPAPLLHACALAGSVAAHCLFVGDARCDIAAGRAAGMPTLVALYGYIPAGENPAEWQPDALIDHPSAVLTWLDARITVPA